MKKFYTLISGLILAGGLSAQTTVNINDNSLQGNQTYNWTKNNVYLIDGLTFLEEGGILNIEAGTVIKFTQPVAGSTSALVIARGAKIMAMGTADEPIIFTSELDDVNDATDLGPDDVQLWAGLVILGKATTEKNGAYEVNVEGIPSTEPRGKYGAIGNDPATFDDNDNSGELKYVSIRHTGFGLASGSELQGLTLGGVGRGTKLSYVDIYASSDDGVELFGGTVDLKYFSVAFAEDDSYDFDEVWKGKAQFLFSIQREDVADSGYEYDGSTPDDTQAFTDGTLYNFTHIGSGVGASAANPIGMNIRAGGAINARNGIMVEMKGKGVEIQDKAGNTTTDSYARFLVGETKFENNVFFNIGSATTLDGSSTGIVKVTNNADDAGAAAFSTHLALTNVISNPGLVSISRTQNGMLNPTPSASGAAYTNLAAYPAGDNFFTPVAFKGAFPADPTKCFVAGWSTLAKNGHLSNTLSWSGDLFTNVNEFNNVLSALNVYPNPSNGVVNFSYASENKINIEIYNLNGQLVKSVSNGKEGVNVETVTVSDLTSGLYLVRFTDGNNAYSTKLIIE